MAGLFFALLLVCFTGKAQTAILLDRNLRQPLLVVDSVTMEQVSNGLMPVYVRDIDSILKTVERLMTYVDEDRRDIKGVMDFHAGRSKWTARADKRGIRKLYTIVLNTGFGIFRTYMVVAAKEPNKRALQRLTMFADYLRNNRTQIPHITSATP